MSNEVSVRNNQSVGGSFNNINQGTVAVESNRAIAEAQGKLIMAKQFPRDYTKSYASAIEACQRKGFADKAFFSYPRGGQTVTGVTIRFAEEWHDATAILNMESRKCPMKKESPKCRRIVGT